MTNKESHTRKEIIDRRLMKAGWNVNDLTQVIQEFDIPLASENIAAEPKEKYKSHLFCDYVLLGKDQKPIAIVEAKKDSLDARKGEEQAKQYAQKIKEVYKCNEPFVFYTNGHDIYFWNVGEYAPYKVYGFPTRADLERLAFIRENKTPLAEELINTEIAGRPYQIQAIRTVMEGIEQRRRKFLLVMATGTGKTRTTIALIDTLMRAGWISRALFLVDRIELRNQAVEAIKEHTPNYSVWPNQNEKDFVFDRRLYVSTYPTMLNIVEEEQNSLSPHFFDLIIVDESHRSIYNVYQNILNYFNAVVLGLTATPTDVIDHNTFEVFDCEDGLPSFAYTYDEAVKNIPKYLNDFEVLKISTKFQVDGIHAATISIDDQKKLIAEGKDIEELNFEGTSLEKSVTNKGTNALIVKEFMEECIKDKNGVLPGKTIFFCMTIKHARRIKEIFDQFYPQHKGELAKVIVSEDPRVYGKGGLLDQFKNRDFPRIAISVDMLDTGIDVREAVNLVFAKPVFSYTKFWQMIGRGTRVLDENNLKPWCQTKDKFLIIDCWDNFEYFKFNPKGREGNNQLALPVRYFKTILDKIEIALEKHSKAIAEKEISRLQSIIELLPENNVVVMDNANDLAKLNEKGFWEKIDDSKIEFLNLTIAPIMRAISRIDFFEMRFKKDVLETSITLLEEKEEEFDAMKEVLIAQIDELPLSINIVIKQKDLIKQALRESFWNSITEEKLEEILQKLSPLMRYRKGINTGGDEEVQLNLKDVTYKKETVEFGPENEIVSIKKYKEMVESAVNDLATSNLILQKLKTGKAITNSEIEMLAEMLKEKQPHVTLQLLQKVYDNQNAKFIQFIKHILGIEEIKSFGEVVGLAFDEFISQHNNLGANQIQFLEILRKFIIDKGQISKKDLVGAPFTQIHPNGILGVFKPNEINEIVELTQKISA